MSQEIEDIRDFCREENYSGKELIYALFGKLIEDTAYYPTLATRLINNAILEHERDNPVKNNRGDDHGRLKGRRLYR